MRLGSDFPTGLGFLLFRHPRISSAARTPSWAIFLRSPRELAPVMAVLFRADSSTPVAGATCAQDDSEFLLSRFIIGHGQASSGQLRDIDHLRWGRLCQLRG